ncbi:hypothetical protein SCB49_13900 [unidentified eubacterium SCB49]|nr:hypothetical protein SCB49_13900 [unidentified eubacterium SCB49]
MKKILFLGLLTLICFTTIQAQEANQLLDTYLLSQREQGNISALDASYEITNEHISSISNIHHIYYRQVIDGVPVLGTESGLHLKNGATFTADNNFISGVNDLVSNRTSNISAKEAILKAALSEHYKVERDIVQISKENSRQRFVFSDGGISLSDIPVALAYLKLENSIELVWDISIQEKAQKHWYNLQVSATTGAVLSKFDWMTQCKLEHDHDHTEVLDFNRNLIDIPDYNETNNAAAGCTECYNVFAIPLSSPYYGSRSIEVSPATNNASPFGWHDIDGVAGADFTTTRGNNVNAYEDGDNQGYQPDGGVLLDFSTFPFDQVYSETNQYEDAAITNLFYWNNVIHDVMFEYGFDAKSGNFQENNYGEGGEGSDSVNAEAQDNSGECNANFGTPPDGSNPTMQMYTCNDKDGDYDSLVIVHEYGHGISNRLTGGAANSSCLTGQEQMGEGWSDYFGLMLTMTDNDLPDDAKAVGTYLFGQGPNGNGIRSYPYSTDFSVNPHTYDDIKTESVPHGVGSVWAAMLWEMTWDLINVYGFSDDFMTVTGDITQDAGNIQALLLVTEALKMQPCGPGFVDGRDAILAADVAIYGGANECLIWDAFARRGLGFSADQGSANSRTDGTEAFDTPSDLASFTAPADVCEGALILYNQTGGVPFGGVYSGPGVTDDGNGFSYTFNPAQAGPGVHTIVYNVPDGSCSVASSDSDTVEVFYTPDSPTTTDALLVCLDEEVTVTATLNDPNNIINWYDAIEGGNFLASGSSYTFIPTENTTVYAQEGPEFIDSDLKITEIALQSPDGFEITNIGAAKDYTGYKIAVSEEPFTNFNTVNDDIQELGFIGENTAIYFDDVQGSSNYWGSNIWWGEGGSGWIIILDPDDNVVESVFWNASQAQINTLNVSIDGVNIDASDIEWTGDGADFDEVCNSSFRRVGENDNASNWPSDCLDSDFGIYNTDMQLGFQSCLAQRVPAIVTGEEEAPVIVCPEDMVITQDNDLFEMPDFTSSATVTDNCSFTVSQSPLPGSDVTAGTYTITLTATDSSGNESECEFLLDAVLAIDNPLSNSISLVPNPTFGNMILTYNGADTLNAIHVIDVNGRLIKNVMPSSTSETRFSLVDLADGFYFVKIVAGSNVLMKQVIKR